MAPGSIYNLPKGRGLNVETILFDHSGSSFNSRMYGNTSAEISIPCRYAHWGDKPIGRLRYPPKF